MSRESYPSFQVLRSGHAKENNVSSDDQGHTYDDCWGGYSLEANDYQDNSNSTLTRPQPFYDCQQRVQKFTSF